MDCYTSKYSDLTDSQKEGFKQYCDKKFGKTYCYLETGEPLYFSREGNLVVTSVIIDLLFNVKEN